jgi:hypothetical protein
MEHKSPRCPHVNATSNNTPQPEGAALSHSCGWPLAPPDRLVRALTVLHRLALSPGPSDHTRRLVPPRSLAPPSTACTPGQRWTTPPGPDAGSATTMAPALCVRFSRALPCGEPSPAVPERAREHREGLGTDSPAVPWPWSRAAQAWYASHGRIGIPYKKPEANNRPFFREQNTTWKVMSQISDTLENSCFEINGLRKRP